VNLPVGVDACRDNVDIAVYRRAGMALSSSAAGDFCRGADMDGDEHALEFGNVQNARRIGTELQGEPVGCLAIGEDAGQPDVRRYVSE